MDQLTVRRAENARHRCIVVPGTYTIHVEPEAMLLQQSLIRAICFSTALIALVSQPFSLFTLTREHLQSSQCPVTGHALRHVPVNDPVEELGHWANQAVP